MPARPFRAQGNVATRVAIALMMAGAAGAAPDAGEEGRNARGFKPGRWMGRLLPGGRDDGRSDPSPADGAGGGSVAVPVRATPAEPPAGAGSAPTAPEGPEDRKAGERERRGILTGVVGAVGRILPDDLGANEAPGEKRVGLLGKRRGRKESGTESPPPAPSESRPATAVRISEAAPPSPVPAPAKRARVVTVPVIVPPGTDTDATAGATPQQEAPDPPPGAATEPEPPGSRGSPKPVARAEEPPDAETSGPAPADPPAVARPGPRPAAPLGPPAPAPAAGSPVPAASAGAAAGPPPAGAATAADPVVRQAGTAAAVEASDGRHFIAVRDGVEVSLPLPDGRKPVLRAGTVLRFLGRNETHARGRLPDGTAVELELWQVRDATFDEAVTYLQRGG